MTVRAPAPVRAFLVRLAALFRGRAARERDMAAELESHLQLHTDEGIGRGLSPDEARRQAVLALGGLEATKEDVRDRATLRGLEAFGQDLRFSVRTLRKTPLFTVVVLLTFAIGIGANTAIFGAVNAVLLRPLPYPNADQLVGIRTIDTLHGGATRPTTPADFGDWRAMAQSFSAMAATTSAMFALTGEGEPENIMGYALAPETFGVLGVGPILGRSYAPDDGEQVVLISHQLWERRWHRDPTVLGRTVKLGGEPHRILGVMPPAFRYPKNADLWVPYLLDAAALGDRASAKVRVLARLKPGVSLEQANAEMRGIAARLAAQHPETNQHRGASLEPLRQREVGDIQPVLLVLLGAVGFVLLLTCSNVAGLSLARSATRRREIAVRAALGAGRGRIVRQLLTESVLLAVAGGALGLLLAWWGTALLVELFPRNVDNLDMPIIDRIPLDAPVLLFTFGAALVAGAISGLIPALQTSRTDLAAALRDGGRGSGRAGRLRPMLVTAQLGLALVLMTGAGLLISSSLRQTRALGFVPDGVLAGRLILDEKRYPDAARKQQLLDAVLERLRAAPGVSAAGAIGFLPLSGWNAGAGVRDVLHPEDELATGFGIVDGKYFETMRIPLLAGRAFGPADDAAAPHVLVVDQRFVREVLRGRDPIGARVDLGTPDQPDVHEVVGVVPEVMNEPPPAPAQPMVYAPTAQHDWPAWGLVARTTGDPAALAGALRQAVAAVDPEQPVAYLTTMDDMVADALAAQRMTTWLFVFFAALAALLAAMGLYGVLAQTVLERRREIGIRRALGAGRAHVLKLVLGRVALIAGAGIALGVPAAWAAGRVMGALLHGVSPEDPRLLGAIVLLLGIIALLAALIPLRRAVRIEPMVALRED